MVREVEHGPLLAKIYSSFPLDLKLETVDAVNVDVHLLSLAPRACPSGMELEVPYYRGKEFSSLTPDVASTEMSQCL